MCNTACSYTPPFASYPSLSRWHLLFFNLYFRRGVSDYHRFVDKERLQVRVRSRVLTLFCFFRYVGEWYDRDDTPNGIPTKDMRDDAANTLYATAGVYAIFTALSVVCIVVGSRRK